MEQTKVYIPKLEFDFKELAKNHQDLVPFFEKAEESTILKTKPYKSFKFTNESNNLLFKYIMLDEFDIDVLDLHLDHLCPVIPSRIQYLCIIKEILDECDLVSEEVKIRGIDVGTGYYGIYSLLAHRLFGWEMLALDIDQKSIDNFDKIIKKNRFKDHELRALQSNFFSNLSESEEGIFHFTVCNPPFYDSREELEESFYQKGMKNQTHRLATGSSSELIYSTLEAGEESSGDESQGELGFIEKLIQESKRLEHKVIWFSTLISKRKNVQRLTDYLTEGTNKAKTNNFLVRDFVSGGNTRRWVLIWSYQGSRVDIPYKRFKNVNTTTKIEKAIISLNQVLTALEDLRPYLEIHEISSGEYIESVRISGYDQCWKRGFQRKIKLKKNLDRNNKNDKNRFVFLISPHCIRWKYGHDPIAFQSFQAFLLQRLHLIQR